MLWPTRWSALKPELQENKWRNMPPEAPASGGFLFAENKFQFIELFSAEGAIPSPGGKVDFCIAI